jgi:predicted ATP-binding protein involved in virulence
MERYRGFESLRLELPPRLAVIVGVNGAGKSSVLDCLAVLLSQVQGSIQSRLGHGRRFRESDILNGAPYTRNTVTAEFGGYTAEWTVALVRRGMPPQATSSLAGLGEWVAAVQQANQAGHYRLPLAVYYPVNRAVLDIPRRIRERHEFTPLSAYDDALTGAGNFRLFFEWLRDQEDLEHERIVRNGAMFTPPDPQLAAVRQAIERLVPGFSDLRVQRAPQRMMVNKNGVPLAIDQLSDGEKCLIAVAGDLARRLALANPGNPNPLSAPAVVLLDEIELHLHPGWQRVIIERLLSTFPTCQFILTTHSPQVLSAVPSESVVMLRDFAPVRPAAPTEGRDSNAILAEVMDVPERPERIQIALADIARLIDEDRLGDARAAIDRLAETLSERDAEIVRLRSLVTFLEAPA